MNLREWPLWLSDSRRWLADRSRRLDMAQYICCGLSLLLVFLFYYCVCLLLLGRASKRGEGLRASCIPGCSQGGNQSFCWWTLGEKSARDEATKKNESDFVLAPTDRSFGSIFSVALPPNKLRPTLSVLAARSL